MGRIFIFLASLELNAHNNVTKSRLMEVEGNKIPISVQNMKNHSNRNGFIIELYFFFLNDFNFS